LENQTSDKQGGLKKKPKNYIWGTKGGIGGGETRAKKVTGKRFPPCTFRKVFLETKKRRGEKLPLKWEHLAWLDGWGARSEKVFRSFGHKFDEEMLQEKSPETTGDCKGLKLRKKKKSGSGSIREGDLRVKE